MMSTTEPLSRWSRFRLTPLRDIVRCRLTGRLDIEGMIARHALPERLATLARDVSKRTRLSRLERAEIAAELSAHLADAVAKGQTEDDIVQRFGDPVVAARLLRRAARRKRPFARRLVTYGLWSIVGLVGLYAITLAIALAARPSPPVDYRPLLNTHTVASEPSDRAWPTYLSALLAIGPRPYAVVHTDAWPGDETWAPIPPLLAAHVETLATVHDAARRPHLGFVLGSNLTPEEQALWPDQPIAGSERIIDVRLSHLSGLRTLAALVTLEARQAAAAGDADVVLRNLETLHGLAAHAEDPPLLISGLVAGSITRQAYRVVQGVLAKDAGHFGDEDLARLAHRMAATDAGTRVYLDAERIMFEDLVQRMYTDDGRGDGAFTRAGLRVLDTLGGPLPPGLEDAGASREREAIIATLAMPAVRAVVPSRRATTDRYNELMTAYEDAAAKPLWTDALEPVMAHEETMRGATLYAAIRGFPLNVLLPAVAKPVIEAHFVCAERDAVGVTIGLELFRREHGRWPATLDDLVPTYLPAVPPDPLAEGPLRFALIDGAPVLYSYGADRDDDGGRPSVGRYRDDRRDVVAARWVAQTTVREWEAAGRAKDLVPDGDWIIFRGRTSQNAP